MEEFGNPPIKQDANRLAQHIQFFEPFLPAAANFCELFEASRNLNWDDFIEWARAFKWLALRMNRSRN